MGAGQWLSARQCLTLCAVRTLTSRRRWPRELPVLPIEHHHFCQAADKWREHRPRGLRQLPQDTGSRQSRLAPAFVDPSASRSLSEPWPQIGGVALASSDASPVDTRPAPAHNRGGVGHHRGLESIGALLTPEGADLMGRMP
jgi:hypothetical protein